jgi:hypothetical protein
VTDGERVHDLNLIKRNSRPELRSPPPLTPEGQVATPEPEKTFIQKYWMYALAFMLVLGRFGSLSPSGPNAVSHGMGIVVMAPAPPEEEGGAGPGGSGQGGK